MITIALTYRNRELRIVKNCLDSLQNQTQKNFSVFLVDYGSEALYAEQLEALETDYDFITVMHCPVSGQLWNKSRAINIALKQCNNPYFLVGDIDLIFREDFMEKISKIALENKTTYFQVGFLDKEASATAKQFQNYKIKHISSSEATGITLFRTSLLKYLNGYDEFYHGWGSEDTDVHVRLLNGGYEVNFYDAALFLLHQWHPKAYRSKNSPAPFHSQQERVNHFYMQLTQKNNITKANIKEDWGLIPLDVVYKKLLKKPKRLIEIDCASYKLDALVAQLKNLKGNLIDIIIKDVSKKLKIKQQLKKLLGKKHVVYLEMEEVNNRLLEEIINNYRNLPYQYTFNKEKNEINLRILF